MMIANSTDEIHALAKRAFAEAPAADHVIRLVPGEHGGVDLRALEFAGTLNGGGSLTIEGDGATVRGFMARGSGPLIVRGLTVSGGMDRETWGTKPSESQFLFAITSWAPRRSDLWLQGCRFIGPAGEPWRWRSGAQIRAARLAIITDCEFDGFYNGLSFSSVDFALASWNTFRRGLADYVRAMGSYRGQVTPAAARIAIRDNLLCDQQVETGYGSHADGIQIGTGADGAPYDLDISGNVLYLAGPRGYQGIYLDDTTLPMSGRIRDNIVVCGAPHGIATWWADGLRVERNAVITDTSVPRPRTARNGAWITSRKVGAVFEGNASFGPVNILPENLVSHIATDHRAKPGDPRCYADVYRGAFFEGPHGMAWNAPDASDANRFKTWARTQFAFT